MQYSAVHCCVDQYSAKECSVLQCRAVKRQYRPMMGQRTAKYEQKLYGYAVMLVIWLFMFKIKKNIYLLEKLSVISVTLVIW